jgi:exoribonuclease R
VSEGLVKTGMMEYLHSITFQHKPMSEITSGLHRGIYHQGKLRVNRYNPFEAYVGSESIGDEIIIYGRSNMNRAFDGDIVAVELLPQDQWQGEKSLSIAGEGMLPKLSVSQKADLQLVKIYECFTMWTLHLFL